MTEHVLIGKRIIGKRIIAVFLAEDKCAIRFDLDEGKPSIIARAWGDCCSSTWIESLDTPELLLGKVVSVEDIEMPDKSSRSDDDCEVIKYYGCKITTTKGSCVIDYRNSSNGYYGGDLSWPGEDFYEGVFDQNVSKEDWKLVVKDDFVLA